MSKRVLIGMSGGIDSTVAAILLLEQGYELVGATFRTFDPSPIANSQSPNCASEQSILDAQHMAATLGFEHHILDFRDTFREHVIANFVSEYAHGRTPNPCVMCNSHIKWGKLMQAAEQYGCDLIATGHYAQIADYRGHTYLKNAVDTHKDQTYFLWMLTEENLRHTIFPLGGLTKTEVRQIALNHGFEALSTKAESQEICFVPNNDYRTFLAEQGISVPQGEYVDHQGKILGMHQGYCHYTIGQRRGLDLPMGERVFVTGICPEKNEVVIGKNEDIFTTKVLCDRVNFMAVEDLPNPRRAFAKIRYNHKGEYCMLEKMADGKVLCTFEQPVRAATPGQAVVFYDGEYVLGGGTILHGKDM